MTLTRRQLFALSAGVAGVAMGLRIDPAFATTEDMDKLIGTFTGGKTAETGRITLTAPEIAENGNTVPVSVSVESAMDGDDLVESVALFADGNPLPEVAVFHFTAMSGKAEATTRMRLARTQNVVAVAKMKDGSLFMDKREVKVTIGGCGG